MRTVHVVLPVFDEQASIGRLLEHIALALDEAALPYRVVLVDDGSRDATAEVVARYVGRLPLSVHRHPQNLWGWERRCATGWSKRPGARLRATSWSPWTPTTRTRRASSCAWRG